ncbi:MAG: hypothetical protein GY874_12510 [Desulfobacteraceae bacterium]|nr:hypothetical protein [Desulfobacteraceae bacterium]
MQHILDGILCLNNIKGCLFIKNNGKIDFAQFHTVEHETSDALNWSFFTKALADIHEADLVFENARCYLRKAKTGYLLVILEAFASLSAIKLQCDLIIPKLNALKPKGLKRFFQK